jgi:hypothetical protein
LKYVAEDPNSVFIEKILHHLNKRILDWDNEEKSRIYLGRIIKSLAHKPFILDLRSPEFAKFTAMIIYTVNTEFKSPRITFYELPFLMSYLFRYSTL